MCSLCLVRLLSFRRNFRFWSNVLGKTLWSQQISKWHGRIVGEKWADMIQGPDLLLVHGDKWWQRKKQVPPAWLEGVLGGVVVARKGRVASENLPGDLGERAREIMQTCLDQINRARQALFSAFHFQNTTIKDF